MVWIERVGNVDPGKSVSLLSPSSSTWLGLLIRLHKFGNLGVAATIILEIVQIRIFLPYDALIGEFIETDYFSLECELCKRGDVTVSCQATAHHVNMAITPHSAS